MRPHAVETVFLASSLLASSTGCSFATHGAGASFDLGPGVEQHASSPCAGSDAAPVVHTVIGSTLVAVGTGVIVVGSEGNKPNEGWLIASGVGIIVLGGLNLVSAATGFDRNASCRASMHARTEPVQRSPRYLLDVGALAQARAPRNPGATASR